MFSSEDEATVFHHLITMKNECEAEWWMVHVYRGVHQHQHHELLRFFTETPHHELKGLLMLGHQHHH